MKAYIIADLGFGDSGKGTTVDYLCRAQDVKTVVRYNGGAQAGHNVVTPDGRHHTFSQFGAGTFVDGVSTYLSENMVIEPLAMMREEEHLRTVGVYDAYERLIIDGRAVVATPFHQAFNRLTEMARGDARHGSCGMGIGSAAREAMLSYTTLRAEDLMHADTIREKLTFIRDRKRGDLKDVLETTKRTDAVRRELAAFEEDDVIDRYVTKYQEWVLRVGLIVTDPYEDLRSLIFRRPHDIVFEGAHPALLDAYSGFYPYTSWTRTGFNEAEEILQEYKWNGETVKLGVTRLYHTRHGAGPLPTEDKVLSNTFADPHNPSNSWQQHFRVGHLDFLMLEYGAKVVGKMDGLVVTHIDQMANFEDVWAAGSYWVKQPHNRCFVTSENGRAVAISGKPYPPYMEYVTEALQHVEPVLDLYAGAEHLMEAIERTLKVPIVIESRGPTWEDKMSYALQLLETA